jgi:membrane protein
MEARGVIAISAATDAYMLDQFERYLWRKQERPSPMRQLLRITFALGNDLIFGRLTLWAGSLVYTTLLSLVPLLAVSFSLFKAFGIHNQLQPLLHEFLTPLGTQGEFITNNIIEFVDRVDVAVLGATGVAMLFVTAILTISKIEDAFNEQWQIRTSRPWVQRGSYYLSMLMLIPLLAFSGIGITESLLNSQVAIALFGQQLLGSASTLINVIIPVILTIAVFSLVYTLLPNTAVKFRHALISGCVITAAWKLCGWLFASLISGANQYDAIYSSFAILIVFLLWLYLSWLIFLVGARLCMYLQLPQQLLPAVKTREIDQEYYALAIMRKVGQSFVQGTPGPQLHELSLSFHLNTEILRPLIEQLQKSQLLCELKDRQLVPCRDLNSISLHDIIASTHTPLTSPGAESSCAAFEQSRTQHQHLIEKEMNAITLRHWLDQVQQEQNAS